MCVRFLNAARCSATFFCAPDLFSGLVATSTTSAAAGPGWYLLRQRRSKSTPQRVCSRILGISPGSPLSRATFVKLICLSFLSRPLLTLSPSLSLSLSHTLHFFLCFLSPSRPCFIVCLVVGSVSPEAARGDRHPRAPRGPPREHEGLQSQDRQIPGARRGG